MSDNHFLRKVEAVRQRVDKLRQHSADRLGQSEGVSPAAFEGLLTMLEELQVAAQELCQQNKELAAVAVENARLLETLHEQREVAETLREVAGALSASLDHEQVLRLILGQLLRVVDYDSASVMLVSGDALDLAAYRSFRFEQREFTPLRIDALSHVHEVIENGVPVIIPDTTGDSRWLRLGDNEFTRCWLGVPLMVQDRVIGLLNMGKRQPDFYTERHAALAVAFADQAAIAIENARLFEQVRAGRERLQSLSRQLLEVQETERRRIAHELHDEVSQILTGLKLTLETIRRLPPDMGRVRLGEAQELVNELMARMRNMSLDLRPSMLDDAGLVPTLLWHFERYTDQTGVAVNFEHNEPERSCPPEVETATYRIVQEALTNVARHAGVSEATVCLLADQEMLSLRIEDCGAGFDPDAVLATGGTFGLVGMRERAVLLGGQLVVESAPGTGTRLMAELPLGNLIEQGEAR